MEDMPLHFTLHRGETVLTHDETVGPMDETLNLTERVSGGRSLCSLISKLMELFYGQITEPLLNKFSRSARKKWTILNSPIYDLLRNPASLLTSAVCVTSKGA